MITRSLSSNNEEQEGGEATQNGAICPVSETMHFILKLASQSEP